MSTPANDNRPASYDQQLQEHAALVRRLARKISYRDADDVAQDIMLCAVRTHKHRDERYPFSTWLHVVAGNVRVERYRASTTNMRAGVTVADDTEHEGAVQPSQHIQAELAEVLRTLSGTRDGEALVRLAMGDKLEEVAADFGVSRERVRQLAQRARQSLQVAA
jgi:RNA polymerase sigma factor (sigma-70 family)